MVEWVNWAETFRSPVRQIKRPRTLAGLQKVVRSVTHAEGRVHAEGSRWAFSVPAYCEDTVVDTSRLNTFPKVLQYAIVKPEREPGRLLLAVEAGIKIRDLYRAIAFDRPRGYSGPGPDALPPELTAGRIWTLPVLGGAGGQSLAGVVNTGTHGGDAARPPLSDAVRAILIVTLGGRLVLLEPDPGRGLPIVDADQLAASLGQHVIAHRDTALFDAAVVSVGRFGVVWAYVIEVHDETTTAIVETRTQTTWGAVRAGLVADAMGAAARDEFLQLVINPYPAADLGHACYVTRHRMVPGHPTDPGRAPRLPHVDEARSSSGCHLAFQVMGFDEPLAFVSDVIELLRSIHPLELVLVPYAVERAGHLGHLRPNGERYVIGDFMADLFELLTTLGRSDVISILTRRILDIEQRDHIAGPVGGPWEVKGTRFEIADFYDYGARGYRGDSVELFFRVNPADPTELPATIDALLRVFHVLRGEGQPVAAYIALRFMAATRATLGMARWAPTCSVELAMLRGLRGNARALRLLQEVCLARGGVVHWGQQHNLEPRDIAAGFGPAFTRWREQLRGFHGSDVVFSTPFTRARNLEAADSADWTGWNNLGLPGRGAVALPDGFDVLSQMEVFARDDGNVMHGRRILRNGMPLGVWYSVRPEPVGGRASVFRGRSGRLELFAIDDGFLKHTYQEAPLTTSWSSWDVKGYPAPIRYEEAIGDAADRPTVAVTAHGDGRIETFGRASRVDEHRLAHCWANARDGWGWSTVWHRGRGALTAAPSAANRRLADGRDHIVVVAADTHGVIMSMHQVDPANSADWSDWQPLDPGVGSVGTRGAVVVASARAPLHVFTVGPRDHIFFAVDRGTGLAPAWGSWRELDVEVDPQSRLAVVATRGRIWVATRTLRGDVVCWDFAPGSVPFSRLLGGMTRKDVALGAYPGEDAVYVAVRDDTRSGRVVGRRVLASS